MHKPAGGSPKRNHVERIEDCEPSKASVLLGVRKQLRWAGNRRLHSGLDTPGHARCIPKVILVLEEVGYLIEGPTPFRQAQDIRMQFLKFEREVHPRNPHWGKNM